MKNATLAFVSMIATMLPASGGDRIVAASVSPARNTIQIMGSFPNAGHAGVTFSGMPLVVEFAGPNQIVAELPAGIANGAYRLTAGNDTLDVSLALPAYGFFYTLNPIRIDANGTTLTFDQKGPAVNVQSAFPAAGIVLERPGDYLIHFELNQLVPDPANPPPFDLTLTLGVYLNGVAQPGAGAGAVIPAHPAGAVSVQGSAIVHSDGEKELLQLQAALDKRNQLFDIMTQIIDHYDATAKVIIQQIGR